MRSYFFGALFLLLSALMGAANWCYAQQSHIDSLENGLNKRDPVEKYEGLLELGRYYLSSNMEKSLEFVSLANQLAYQLKDSARIVQSGYALGFIYRRQNNLDEAIKTLSDVLAISKRNNFEEDFIKTANLLALAYTFLADYDKALEFHFSCLAKNDTPGREEDLSITLNNIGLVYFKLEEIEESLKYYQQSLEVKRKFGIDFDLDRLYVNIALCHNRLKQFNEAEEAVQLAFRTCEGDCNDDLKAEAEFALGISNLMRGKLDEAEKNLLSSITSSRVTKNLVFEADAFLTLANVYQQSDTARYLQALKQAESVNAKTDNLEQQIRILRELGKAYENRKDFLNTLRYKNLYISLSDSSSGAEMRKNLVKVQTKYFERENLRTIEEKNQLVVLQEEAISRQRLLIMATSTIAALFCILIYIMFRSARQQAISKRKLAEANEAIENHNRNLQHMVKVRTNELRLSNMELKKSYSEYDHLIYRASHDIRGPLTTLLGLTNLAKQEQGDPVKVKDYLSKIEVTTEGLSAMLSQLTEINLIRNQPICIESLDIGAISEEVFRSFSHLNHFPLISLRLSKGNWSTGLKSDGKLIRLILGHLIHNSLKYFKPTRQEKYVKVSWSQTEDRTTISVEDNGQGIDEKAGGKVFQLFYVASDSHGMGLGLFVAQLAARRLGGRIKLRKSKEPTTFQIILPNDSSNGSLLTIEEDDTLYMQVLKGG